MSVANMDLSSLADKSKTEMEGKKKQLRGNIKPKTKQVSFTMLLPQEIYDFLDKEAERRGTSKKSLIVDSLLDKFNI